MKVKKTTTGILATATLCVFASTARAGTVNLYDGTFGNLTFVQSTANRSYGFGPSQTTSITAGVMSGNVDNLQADPNAISVQFTWSGPNSTASAGLGVLDNALVYNPSTQGAIVDIDLSANRMLAALNTNAPGAPLRFLLQQSGNFFVYQTPAQTGVAGQYTNYTASNLGAGDFSNICLVNCGSGLFTSVPANPASLDFSASGAPITFGLLAIDRYQSGSGGRSINVFFDNLAVELTNAPAAPEPATWAMMLVGFASVSWLAYRRRNQASLQTA